jgi:CRISPR-associated protein Csy1
MGQGRGNSKTKGGLNDKEAIFWISQSRNQRNAFNKGAFMVIQIPDPQEVAAIRAVVDGFIQERLQLKLDKLKDDDEASQAKRTSLRQEHARETWLADAAKRVQKVQLITHSLKGVHSGARGTSVYLDSSIVRDKNLVGTHVLSKERSEDVVSDSGAAFLGKDATDAVELLKLEVNGVSLLNRFKQRDASALLALTVDKERADALAEAFTGVTEGIAQVTSHTLGKQLYFPTQEGGYHLLAPLFPTTLVHHLHATVQEDRFSDQTKVARDACKAKQQHPHGYRDHLNMVVRYLGGTKPLNVSILNNKRHVGERGGANYLLASVPPVWKDQGTQPPLRVASVFDKRGAVGRDRTVYFTVKALRPFLKSVADVDSNMDIRNKRAELVQAIIDRVLDIATELQCLPSGWSADPTCKLSWAQKQWLDTDAVEAAQAAHALKAANPAQASSVLAPPEATEWREPVAEQFAHWLNAAISTEKTPMGDVEFVEWKHAILEVLP